MHTRWPSLPRAHPSKSLSGSIFFSPPRPTSVPSVHPTPLSPPPPACPHPHTAPAAPVPRGSARPLPPDAISCLVQVFGRRQRRSHHTPRRPASEKRQGTKSRREVVRRWCRGLYGDLAAGRDRKAGRFAEAVRLDRGHNLDVTARILLNGDFTFCPINNFNALRMAKQYSRQLLRDELHGRPRTPARAN